jgi:hypothetical protein
MVPKIIELIIQDGDEEGGLDGISLVELPAHEAEFEFFSKEEEKQHYILSDEEIPQIIQMFHAYGEPQGLLEKEGFIISEVKTLGRQDFQILSDPNAPSSQDTPDVKFRYKYVGPRDTKNRTFCAEMMTANRVFRIEDILEMSNRSVNSVGPDGYDIFTWRGSYNCRHRWVQLIYRSDASIINKASVRRGLIDEDGMPGPDTRTDATIAAGNTPPRTGFAATNPNVSQLQPYVDQVTKKVERAPILNSLPMFKNREDALAMAEAIGCKGAHSMGEGENLLWMPCEDHIQGDESRPDMYGLEEACWPGYEAIGTKIGDDGREVPNCVPIKEEMNEDGTYVVDDFASYDDYPELVRENAKKVLDYIERTGNPNNCMTQVGKVRAQQLAQGKRISIETVKRMKAYISRHKKDLQVSKSYDDGCGLLAMDAWGGVEALPWVERTIAKYEEMNAETEITFSVFNNEQRLVVGPAMIPDKMIIRRNEITGEIYYVYFTAETIKKLQQKFMQEKLLDKTNIEHGRKFLSGVDVVESWIVEDRKLDKQQVFGMDYPKGTWMISMKVNDDKTWSQVKDGKLKGFSVQGYFMEKAKFKDEKLQILAEIKNILKGIK